MFITADKVAVTLDNQNIIFIKSKMDIATKNKVMDGLMRVGGSDTVNEAQISVQMGAYSTALLVHNILDWKGPLFKGVACIPQNIERLDPDEPLIDAVIEAITTRNPLRRSPDPKSPAIANGSTSAGERDSEAA